VNPWQLARQIRYLLRAATWPDGAAEKVLGSAHVSAGMTEDALHYLRAPFALIAPAAATPDEYDPKLLQQTFDLHLVAAVAGDPFGEQALIGGPRSAGQGSSLGRGLSEVEEEVLDAVAALTGADACPIVVAYVSALAAADIEGAVYASRSYVLRAVCTVARQYTEPVRLAATDAGGGSASLTWAVPPDRFDRYNVVLRRASGATAPSSVTAGTGVTLASLLATSVTDTPGSGQFSYALFAGYDELGAGSADRYSSSATVTITLA
jgi:hypothetical protein